MPIPDGLNDREHRKFKESLSTPSQPAVAIVNPDGSNVGGSGGTSMVDDSAFVQGANSLTPAGFLGDDAPNGLGADERIGVARMRRSTRVQLAELVDQSGNPISDDANDAVRVNVVAGGAGGGAAQTQVRNAADTAWDNVGSAAANGKMPVRIYDGSGNVVAVLSSNPAGTEFGLVTRNIPSGTQPISAASLPLPSGAATETTLGGRLAEGTPITGESLEAGGSSGLGWLSSVRKMVQAVRDRLPSALVNGHLDVSNVDQRSRQHVALVWERMAGTTSESALQNFTTGVRAGSSLSAANNYQVQNGKAFRITLVTVTIRNVTTATLVSTRVRIRQAASVANNSPIIFEAEVGMVPAATLENTTQVAFPIPEGLDVDAAQQITVTHIDTSANCTVTVTINAFEFTAP